MEDHIPILLVMLFCVVMSGYFSATETAFLSMNKTKMRTMAEKGNRRAALTLKLSDKYENLISTILIGNNIVNILLSSLGTVLFIHLFGEERGAAIATAVITVVVLVFGEISPKSIAKDVPEAFAMFSAPILRLFMLVLTPFNWIFSAWKKLLEKLLRVEKDDSLSQEELLMLVDEVEEGGTIDTDEGDLLRNVIEFTDRTAEDILTPRVNLEGIEKDMPLEEITALFAESPYSRLLVYDDDLDHIVGVLHQKAFYKYLHERTGVLEDVITAPLFIHKGEQIHDLLKVLQNHKSHMAIVMDDYGGTLGIVTMEDILEEIVGDIWDEHDEVVEDFQLLSEDEEGTVYRVDCSVNFEDFCEYFGLEAQSDCVSVGGWIMEQLGKVPDLGDSFLFAHLTVAVTEIEERRIAFAEVRKHPLPDAEDEETAEADD
ncbi:MAG: HlyC/CorC family transporter [Clostridia bacterium]|nr:HlyC/CorC family transporter [Clostridia bacterium]